MTTRARRAPVLGVMAAIVLLALNLRTLVAGLPPLLDDIRDDLGLSGLAGGLLTTLPVLAFGAFAPLAPRLSRRVPIEWLLVGCALVTAVAAALRGAGGVAPLFLGCALAGVAVAVAQALLPVFIRTRHPRGDGDADRRVLDVADARRGAGGGAGGAAGGVARLVGGVAGGVVGARRWWPRPCGRRSRGGRARWSRPSRRPGCGATGWRGW